MFDTAKDLSPDALRFITLAAGIPENSKDFSVAVSYIQNPVLPIDRFWDCNRVTPQNVLSWKPEILSPFALMLATIDSPEPLNHSSMSVEERGLWNRAERIRMIWGYEHSTGEDKAKFARILESFHVQV